MTRPAERTTPEEAHRGDIEGALGTIRMGSDRPRTMRQRLLAFLAIVGPGIIVMVGDNDAGGVATYSQAGQNYGTSLLWVLLLLIPVLVVNQEMVVRLGAVTGMGYGKMIFERFGRFWGFFSVGNLFLLNFLTLVTEFIGVSLALGHLGVSPYISVPLVAALLLGFTLSGSFRRWERFMFVFIAANLLIIPLFFLSHPRPGPILLGFLPGVQGGPTSSAVFLIIAIVGTTVAPWQLFFQQSNIVDKRITPRWIPYERVDTILGSFVTALGASALLSICAFAFEGTRGFGHFVDAAGVAAGLARSLGLGAGVMYSVVLLNASLIGAAALSLATSYAVGDTFGVRHSLHRSLREAPAFYGSFAAIVLGAAGVVLIPAAPLGLITLAVQALAGILVPSASTFLLLLCNDRAVLGPWVNRPWLNALAVVIISVLLMLSAILTVTTVFPSIDVTLLAIVCGVVLVIALLVMAVLWAARRPAADDVADLDRRRRAWSMPQLALVERPAPSFVRRAAMAVLSVYLVVAVLLLLVKSIQLATGHG